MPDAWKDYHLRSLLDRLRKSKTDPGEIHPCSACGGDLHVHFEPYLRDERTLLGVHAICESCNATMAVDYAPPLPEWLQTGQV